MPVPTAQPAHLGAGSAELAQALPLLQLLLGLLKVLVLLLALLGLPLNAQLVVGVACGVWNSAVSGCGERRRWRRQRRGRASGQTAARGGAPHSPT